MARKLKFNCPHCGERMIRTEMEVVGLDALMNLMPGPRLTSPEGSYPCDKCEKPIDIKAILKGEYSAPSPVAVVIVLLIIIGGIAWYFLS